MTDDQAVPPPAITALITGMLATRYSAQVQPRDLDVAKVAYAAAVEACARLAEQHNAFAWHGQPTLSNLGGAWVSFADLIRARTTP